MLNLIKHPLTKNINIDDPETTLLRKDIIKQKPFLKYIYEEWYDSIIANIPQGDGKVLELGSGAGFLNEFIPGLITTEVFFCPLVKIIMDGCSMPLHDRSCKAIILVNVFHHIPTAESFLKEASRCLIPGGRIIMLEPWVTRWSYFVYSYLHHEPFDVRAHDWSFKTTGPLSGSNHALPWIVFKRDREIFLKKFPDFHISGLRIVMPFRYLLSGGLGFRSFMPGFTFRFWKTIEMCIGRWNEKLGMFAVVVLERKFD